MADSTYTPPEVWSVDTESGGRFANINRPTAGAREEKELPVGKQPFQLHSLATPNAYTVNIGEGEQFTSGFVAINPNSKIPALVDQSGDEPFRIFESGAILIHLAEKFGEFLPTDPAARAETLSWLFWQVGTGPFIGGGFGHFYAYAPEKLEYPINRYAMEVKRIFDVADKRLGETRFLAGDEYTIADIANYPWLAPFVFGKIYNEAKTFLSIHEYENVARWVHEISARPAVKRGRIVNKVWGDDEATQMRERHSSADFEGKKLD